MTTTTKKKNTARKSKRFVSAVHTITYVPNADGTSLTATIDGIEVYTGTSWLDAFEAINTAIEIAGTMAEDAGEPNGCNPFPYIKQAAAQTERPSSLSDLLGDLGMDDLEEVA